MIARSAHWLSQNVRIGWFLGQYVLSNRLSRPLVRRAPASAPRRPMPTLAELLDDIRELLREDWRNIRGGVYRAPADDDPRRLLVDAVRYFRDLPAVNARRRRRGFDEVRRDADAGGFPEYYLRNFHYQTDGYLSARSARLYDHQVEVLFLGSADAMRRRALVPISGFVRRRRGAPDWLDVACGTGRFVASVLNSFPQLRPIGLDLSPHYLLEAARVLQPVSGLTLVRGLAEALPFANASLDLLTCVYLLHEVPEDIRLRIAGEFARVLRPGGRVVLVDSLQIGDRPGWDELLAGFPEAFHEPFFAGYTRTDLPRLFIDAGLRHAGTDIAFLSKILVFDKP